MTSTLTISQHIRRKPEDPYAEIRERKHRRLQYEIGLAKWMAVVADMEAGLHEALLESLNEEDTAQ